MTGGIPKKIILLAGLFAATAAHAKAHIKLGLQGLNVHGFGEDPIYYKNMPRRIDEKGRMVPNNELFIQYEEEEDRSQWVGMIGQDCYKNFATYVAWGKYARFSENVNYGFVVGAYFRQTRLISLDGETKNIKEFYTLDVGNGNQFVPMPMGTANFHWSLDRDLGVGFNVGSNIFVTHVVAFMSWQFDQG